MRLRSTDRRGRRERGFILVFVIGLCLMLTTIVLSLTRSVQSQLRSLSAAVETARAEALADGGYRLAAERLALERRGDTPAVLNVRAQPLVGCRMAGTGTLVLSIEAEAGKISLNTSNAALLVAAFEGLGADPDLARRSAEAVLDYRDADDDSRAGGSEIEAWTAEAVAGGMPVRPKNRDFETVDELDRVALIPRALRDALKPLATAHTRAAGIDPERALPHVVQILTAGGSRGGFGSARGPLGLPNSFLDRAATQVYTIRAVAVLDSGARFVRLAIVEFSEASGGGAVLRHWAQGSLAEDQSALAGLLRSELAPC